MVRVLEDLSSNREALSSNPSTTKKGGGGWWIRGETVELHVCKL
jgi:hypothetical protein